MDRLKGRCPSCGSESLFVGSGGYVTCSVIGCKNPGAAHDALRPTPSQPAVELSKRCGTCQHAIRIPSTVMPNGDETPDFTFCRIWEIATPADGSGFCHRWEARS
jgi:predicted CxxxxCH...CXXCH cytochrome family protein